MPGYRRRSRRKRIGRKSSKGWGYYAGKAYSGVKSGLSTAMMAYKAYKTASYLAGLINVEKKFCDVSFAPTAVNNTGNSSWLSSISEGTDYNQRNGISVKAVSLSLRGSVQLPPSVANEGQQIRLILVRDTEDTIPGFGDLLEAVTTYSPLNHINVSRFQVLWDHVYTLSAAGTTVVQFRKYFKCSDHIKWSNTTTGIREGHFYLFYVSDGTGATSNPLLNFYSRMRYIDN